MCIRDRYGAKGPSLPVVTACATSTNTVGEAYRAIRHGYADAIIAGGAEAAINELAIAGFTNCMALSTKNIPEESSIPFDKRRDGFVMGEGAGILILEEYEHAKSRGAKIYAEITGYGNTCLLYTSIASAGLAPSDIGLIICSTLQGDYKTPMLSGMLLRELHISCPVFDLNAACSGFIYALDTAAAYLDSGRADNILVVGAEMMTKHIDWSDLSLIHI